MKTEKSMSCVQSTGRSRLKLASERNRGVRVVYRLELMMSTTVIDFYQHDSPTGEGKGKEGS